MMKSSLFLCILLFFVLEDCYSDEPPPESKTNAKGPHKSHFYCLFHVDLNCKASCTDLGFSNGKCYKGICVCKGVEKNAIRKLRLSGQMILPFLSEKSETGDNSMDHRIIYDKSMLDELVEAGKVTDEGGSTTKVHAVGYHHPDIVDDFGSPYDISDLMDLEATSGDGLTNIADKEDFDVQTNVSPSSGDIPRHHRHRHNYNRNNIIFKLGNPRNLRGTILGVAKEYDPQHLFSGEDKTEAPLVDSVVIQVAENEQGQLAIDEDIKSLVEKLIE